MAARLDRDPVAPRFEVEVRACGVGIDPGMPALAYLVPVVAGTTDGRRRQARPAPGPQGPGDDPGRDPPVAPGARLGPARPDRPGRLEVPGLSSTSWATGPSESRIGSVSADFGDRAGADLHRGPDDPGLAVPVRPGRLDRLRRPVRLLAEGRPDRRQAPPRGPGLDLRAEGELRPARRPPAPGDARPGRGDRPRPPADRRPRPARRRAGPVPRDRPADPRPLLPLNRADPSPTARRRIDDDDPTAARRPRPWPGSPRRPCWPPSPAAGPPR